MKKLIIVSGIHRSGTSWIGKTLSSSKYNSYINEPFNPSNYINNSGTVQKFYWPLVDEQKNILKSINNIIDGKYPLKKNIIRSSSFKDYLKSIYFFLNQKKNNILLNKENYIIKDPFLLFLIGDIIRFFQDTHEVHINLTFRDPESFVASCKKKSWDFNFDNFLLQDSVFKKFEKKTTNKMIELNSNQYSLIDRLTFLWGIINDEIYKISTYKNVHICNHSEFSFKPHKKFEKLFNKNNLVFGKEVLKFIDNTTQKKKENITHSIYSQNIVRHSSDISKYSKDSLTNNESDYILNHQGDRYEKLLNNMEFI